MSTYTLTLTPTETACGVTLAQVAELLPQGLLADNGRMFVLHANTGPALGLATARCAFGAPARFVGFNLLRQLVYREAVSA